MKKKKDDKDLKDDKDDGCLLVSPWSIFVELYKPIFTQMYPNESKMEIYKHLRKKWNQFDDEDKHAYIEKANFKNRAVVRLNNQKLKKVKHDRKTVSAYSLFVEENHKELKVEKPEMSLTERTKFIAEKWKSLSHEQKRPYMNMAKRKTRKMQKCSSESDNDNSN